MATPTDKSQNSSFQQSDSKANSKPTHAPVNNPATDDDEDEEYEDEDDDEIDTGDNDYSLNTADSTAAGFPRWVSFGILLAVLAALGWLANRYIVPIAKDVMVERYQPRNWDSKELEEINNSLLNAAAKYDPKEVKAARQQVQQILNNANSKRRGLLTNFGLKTDIFVLPEDGVPNRTADYARDLRDYNDNLRIIAQTNQIIATSLLQDVTHKHREAFSRSYSTSGVQRFLLPENEAKPIRDSLNQGLAADPKRKELWYYLGTLELLCQNYQLGAAALEKAVEIDNRFIQAWNELGRAHVDWNQPEEARKAYEKALSLTQDQTSPEMDQLRADTHFNLGLMDDELSRAAYGRNNVAEAEKLLRSAKGHFRHFIDYSNTQKIRSPELQLAETRVNRTISNID